MIRSKLIELPGLLALVLLAGVGIEGWTRPRAADAEPYHRRVLAVSEGLPKAFGNWQSRDEPPVEAAVRLLHPNILIQRSFWNSASGDHASFLVVQCKDARDMVGHYPPICYPAQGYKLNGVEDREWAVSGKKLPVREYTFVKTEGVRTQVIRVESLLLLPGGRRFALDIDEIGRAAGSYLRQFYGAAQIQVVFDDSAGPQMRHDVFVDLMTANMAIIDALTNGGAR